MGARRTPANGPPDLRRQEGEDATGTRPENVVAGAPIVVWALDRDGVFILSEGNNLERLGFRPGEMVGRSVFDLFGHIPLITEGVRRALAGESSSGTVALDGLVLAAWYVPLGSPAGDKGARMVGVVIDVTEHERATTERAAGQRRMSKTIRSDERERHLIAFEIHDGPVQDMASAQMHLEAMLDSGLISDGSAREELELALGLVCKAVDESRRVINGLRFPILDELGIVPAIKCLIADQPAGGVSIKLTVRLESERLEPLLERMVYRIVQESVTNVRRHSQSNRAEIRLVQAGGRIELEVRDWGVGFDPANVETKCLGLVGIRERARLVHGRAVIQSSPGEGTQILVTLPVAGAPV